MLITTWHPAFVSFRSPYDLGAFQTDLDRFARLIRGQLRAKPEKFITVPTVAEIRDCVRDGDGFVSVDIETGPAHGAGSWTGKDPTRAVLRTVGLGNKRWGLSYAFEPNTDVWKAIQEILQNPSICKIFTNGPWFDLRVLERYGTKVDNWVDTRDARRAVSSTSRVSLAQCASLYDDAPPWKEGDEGDEKGIVFTEDWEKLKRYNAEDCVRTARVWDGITAEAEWKSKRVQRLYELHTKLSQIAAEMHTDGIVVDLEQRDRLSKQLTEIYNDKSQKFLELVGIPGMRCTPNDLRALLFQRHETAKIKRFSLPDPVNPNQWVQKKFKTIAVDQSALLLLLIEPGCPPDVKRIVDTYWQAEGARKARSTYVTSELLSQAIGADGRVRPGWNTCGTDTGRWSCNSPNLLNLAKKKDEENLDLVGNLPDMRSMYMAAPGFDIIEADYQQQELWVMWMVSGDEVLGESLRSGDVYTEDAKFIFPHKVPKDATKGWFKANKLSGIRDVAKTGHLGFQYAAGTAALFKQFLEKNRNMKWEQCEIVHKGLKRRYTKTVEYWFSEQERVLNCGYSESRILRRRRVYPREPNLTEIANYPIQATASDITNIVTIELHDILAKCVPTARLWLQQYDALYVTCPTRHTSEVSRIMQDVMCKPFEINGKTHSFQIDVSVKDRWGKL